MLLISLYQNRYEIIELLKEFLEEAIPRFQKHFTVIEEEYKKFVDN